MPVATVNSGTSSLPAEEPASLSESFASRSASVLCTSSMASMAWWPFSISRWSSASLSAAASNFALSGAASAPSVSSADNPARTAARISAWYVSSARSAFPASALWRFRSVPGSFFANIMTVCTIATRVAITTALNSLRHSVSPILPRFLAVRSAIVWHSCAASSKSSASVCASGGVFTSTTTGVSPSSGGSPAEDSAEVSGGVGVSGIGGISYSRSSVCLDCLVSVTLAPWKALYTQRALSSSTAADSTPTSSGAVSGGWVFLRKSVMRRLRQQRSKVQPASSSPAGRRASTTGGVRRRTQKSSHSAKRNSWTWMGTSFRHTRN